MPPEILLAEDENRTTKIFTQAADIWCFGMVMLEVRALEMRHILSIYLRTQHTAPDPFEETAIFSYDRTTGSNGCCI